jgi:hypothetical protein
MGHFTPELGFGPFLGSSKHVMNFPVPLNRENFLTRWEAIGISRRTKFHTVNELVKRLL